ncbi:hypothetical protein [Salinarimonas rosea]|uniref:hypothetical protein n=1 Tax=Salinarimonas rosea TaxID=552063 RepID=UPI0003F7F945|nr:hypothetical protein [Salinarimonas rosea]
MRTTKQSRARARDGLAHPVEDGGLPRPWFEDDDGGPAPAAPPAAGARPGGEAVPGRDDADPLADASRLALEAARDAQLRTAIAALPAGEDPCAGCRLDLRPARAQHTLGIYYVRKGRKWLEPLGVREGDHARAQSAFDLWKLQRRAEAVGLVAPKSIPIAAVTGRALDELRPGPGATQRDRETFADLQRRVDRILKHFPGRTVGDLVGRNIRAYAGQRIPDARFTVQRETRYLSPATLRLDILALRRCLKVFKSEVGVSWAPEIVLPQAKTGRERLYSRDEIARMLWAARGRVWDAATGGWAREPVADGVDPATAPRVLRPPEERLRREPIRRAVITMSKSATRIDAVIGLLWRPHPHCGCVDVESGLIHRGGYGMSRHQGKPQLTSALMPDLLGFLERWRRRDLAAGVVGVIHKPIGKNRGKRYKDFPYTLWWRTMADAGLGLDSDPHALCHYCITSLLAAGYDPVAVAYLVGRDPITILRDYLHWNLEAQLHAVGAGRRPPLKLRMADLADGEHGTRRSRRYAQPEHHGRYKPPARDASGFPTTRRRRGARL